MRVSAFYDDSDGYVENAHLNKPANDFERKGARVKLQYIPNDNTDITFIGNYNDSYNGRVFSYIPGFGPDYIARKEAAATGTPASQDTFASVLGDIPMGGPEDYKVYVDQNAFSKTLLKDGQINVNFDTENHSLTSITYYQDVKTEFVSDQDGTPIQDALLEINTEQTLFSQELRLSNIDDSELGCLLGVYYSKSDTSGPGGQTSSMNTYGTAVPVPVPFSPFSMMAPTDIHTQVFGDLGTESFGYFAHLNYHLNDEWSLSCGLRYNDKKKTVEQSMLIEGTSYLFNQEIPFSLSNEAIPYDSYYNVSGRLKLQYQPDEDMMYYVALDSARVVSKIDTEKFQQCFSQWMQACHQVTQGQVGDNYISNIERLSVLACLNGTFRGGATKYLHLYLVWRRLLSGNSLTEKCLWKESLFIGLTTLNNNRA